MNQRHQTRMRILVALVFFVMAGRGIGAQSPQQKPPQQPAPGPGQVQGQAPASTNDFPEDTSNVPVIPANGAVIPAVTDNTPVPALPMADGDPVRSPEDAEAASSSSDSSSSSISSSALAHMPQPPEEPDVQPAGPSKADKKANRVPGLFNRGKTPEQAKAETSEDDLGVGNYYLSRHNFQGALSRFQSALVLDPENPDVYWGLAEAQRNLHDYANAKANYQKLLEYDPDNKHAKEARKLLKEPELANASAQK